MTDDEALERAIAEWLVRKEGTPDLLPGEFARELPAPLRSAFLTELEALAEIDQLASLAPARDLPRRYGDFRVLGELGRGAMGVVFDAEQVSSGARVALKVLHAHVAGDLQSAARFRREAHTAASLVHSGIVPVLGFGETDGTTWLAMARVEGRSLQRLLAAARDPRDVDHQRARRLFDDPRALARALADAADALEFAHRHNVVHRDVKPANLIATDDGRVVVLDFGLASRRDDADALTRTGDFLGTPLYMAPEQAIGAENGTAQSDVHALGGVLYECLCGRPPVQPGSLAVVIDRILHQEPPDPRRVRPGVPDELARIALQCLEKDPRHRYATAATLADDLRRFVDGGVVRARPGGVVRRSLRRFRRRPVAVVTAAALVLLAGLALWAGRAAWRSDDAAAVLQRRADLTRAEELLAAAPERVTAFGGASLRFYARLGLGEQITGSANRSPRAAEALQLLEALVQRWPDDVVVLRAHAVARLDVGDDPARSEQAIAALLLHPAAQPGDRMMAAVHARQRGDTDAAQRLAAKTAGADADADVAYWRAFWLQDEQDHAGAIAAFSQALAAPDLDAERRYRALLHRGWCRTCPDVCQLREAEDDLLQAAALRPRHGTARLLWAALRCLEARSPDDLGAPVQAVTEVLDGAEPWLHVLTARVLLALAEGGTVQDGPVAFGAEFSPIAVLPLAPPIAAALAGLGLQLLDGVRVRTPDAFEAEFHRLTALALTGDHEQALRECDRLAAALPARRAAIELQRARILLADGRAQRAGTAVRAALAADPDLVVAWRLEATIAAHVGDADRRLIALDAALARLQRLRGATSVFPDAAAMLPELQLDRARVLDLLGRRAEALALLRDGDFGGVLAGERSLRVVLQRTALRARFGDPELVVAALPDTLSPASPLTWLRQADARPTEATASVRAAVARAWLPATSVRAFAADPGLAAALWTGGAVVPPEPDTLPLAAVLPHVGALLQVPGMAERLLARADALLQRSPEHAEARLLRALVLRGLGRVREAARFLAESQPGHADDLRGRYLLAAVAASLGDRDQLRVAVFRGDRPLTAEQLDLAAARLPLPEPVAGRTLLQAQ